MLIGQRMQPHMISLMINELWHISIRATPNILCLFYIAYMDKTFTEIHYTPAAPCSDTQNQRQAGYIQERLSDYEEYSLGHRYTQKQINMRCKRCIYLLDKLIANSIDYYLHANPQRPPSVTIRRRCTFHIQKQ